MRSDDALMEPVSARRVDMTWFVCQPEKGNVIGTPSSDSVPLAYIVTALAASELCAASHETTRSTGSEEAVHEAVQW